MKSAENGIELTIEKLKEFFPKMTGEMSKDQRSDNVQQSLKSSLFAERKLHKQRDVQKCPDIMMLLVVT